MYRVVPITKRCQPYTSKLCMYFHSDFRHTMYTGICPPYSFPSLQQVARFQWDQTNPESNACSNLFLQTWWSFFTQFNKIWSAFLFRFQGVHIWVSFERFIDLRSRWMKAYFRIWFDDERISFWGFILYFFLPRVFTSCNEVPAFPGTYQFGQQHVGWT